ncbi:MAG: ATP-binding protein [Cyclobacteriaceae bacterium]
MNKSSYVKVVFSGIIVLLLFTSYVTYRNIERYIDESRSIRHSNEIVTNIQNVRAYINLSTLSRLRYQVSKDSLFLDSQPEFEKDVQQTFTTLDSLVADDPIQHARMDTLTILVDQHANLIEEILGLEQNDTIENKAFHTTQLLTYERELMKRLQSLVVQIKRGELETQKLRVSKEQDFRNLTPLSMLLYSLIALGACTFLFINITDALERKQKAEKELHSKVQELNKEVSHRTFAENSLQKVLDGSPSGISAFTAVRNDKGEIVDFRYFLLNKTGEVFLKRKANDLIGRCLLEEMPNHKPEGLFDIYREVVETGQTHSFEKHYVGEGIDTWFDINAVKHEDGFVVTFTDITQHKNHINKIQEKEILLKEAELLNDMGNWKWERTSDKVYWSEGMYRVFGENHKTYVPEIKSLFDGILKEDQEQTEEFINENIKAKKPFQVDFRIVVDDNIKYLQIKGRPIFNEWKRLAGYFGTIQDFTPERKLEEQLRMQTMELKRSNEDLEQFAYVASHDLQEPLRKIQAFGDRLDSKYSHLLDETGLDYIKRMQNAAGRMQKLIEDLLEFSRITRKKVPFAKISLNKIVESVLDDTAERIESTGAKVHVDVLPEVLGDKAQLHRLFLNIIGNALKFHQSGKKTEITIDSKVLQSSEVLNTYAISTTTNMYAITVKDNGIGFDEKHAERIFNIFQRLHGRTAYSGTGIGLAICRKIAMAHHGFIIANGEEGKGAEFIVLLPIEKTPVIEVAEFIDAT